ncbi:Hypothetical predicted protein [Cloeon dipterum]|uniref:BED-type domain-containing protein n=1 Tax=Cloeon dipterum TaxID=197152 RepID=A0A8S1C3Y6_9INSE|nr:Hypothetical predicted protein [Cloeon dipterum]
MSNVEETVVEFEPQSEDEAATTPAKVSRPSTSKRETKSDVWAYFQKNELTGICNLCGKEVRHGGGTTNVRAHLRAKHHMVYVLGMDPTDPRVLEAEATKSSKKRPRRRIVKSEGSKQDSVVYFEVEDQMRIVGNEPQAYFMVNEDGTVEKAPAPQEGLNISAMSVGKPILARISPNCPTVPMYVAAHSEFRLGLRCRSPQVRLRGFTISTQTCDPFFLANVPGASDWRPQENNYHESVRLIVEDGLRELLALDWEAEVPYDAEATVELEQPLRCEGRHLEVVLQLKKAGFYKFYDTSNLKRVENLVSIKFARVDLSDRTIFKNIIF